MTWFVEGFSLREEGKGLGGRASPLDASESRKRSARSEAVPLQPYGDRAYRKRQKNGAMTLNYIGGCVKKYRFGIGGVARITPHSPNTIRVY